MMLSKYPDCAPGDEDGWIESDRECPQCQKLVWVSGWWDDLPENGGACIGMRLACGDCGWSDTE